MTSEDNVQVSQLDFTKKEPEVIRRKVRRGQNNEHLVNLPSSLLEQLGVLLNAEIYIEFSNVDLMLREVKIRFPRQIPRTLSEQFKKGSCQSHSKDDPSKVDGCNRQH